MPDAFGNPLPGEASAQNQPATAAIVAPPSGYPDMTPTPGQRTATAPVPSSSPDILGTAWKKNGSTEHGEAEPWQEQGTPLDRIMRATGDAYYNAPSQGAQLGRMSAITPDAEDWVNRNLGWAGRNIVNPAATAVGTGIADVAGIGAGVGQAAQEGLRAVVPSQQLRRDLTILPASINPGLAEVSTALSALSNRPSAQPAPNPNYVGDLKPGDVAPPKPITPTVQGLLGPVADGDVSATGVYGPYGAPSGYTKPAIPPVSPTTAAEMKPVATFLLDKARASGADMNQDYTNTFIDKVTADAMPAGPGTAAVSGPSDPVTAMVQRLQGLRDQPLSIKDVMGMDQELNARKRAVINSDPDLARRLGDLQDTLRSQIDAATSTDVGGGSDGWQAFSDGRAAYSQYKKMQTLEDIRDKALGMEQPATAMQSNISKWATDPKKSWGLDDSEKDALSAAGDRGYLGEVVRSAGGRLAAQTAGPVVGAMAGAMTPFPIVGPIIGAMAGKGVESLISTAVRKAGVNAQLGKVSDALKVLGSKVQVPTDMSWPPP